MISHGLNNALSVLEEDKGKEPMGAFTVTTTLSPQSYTHPQPVTYTHGICELGSALQATPT